ELRWSLSASMPTPLPRPPSFPYTTLFRSAAPLPDGAQAIHDNHEAVDSIWLAPRLALERYWAGDIDLAPPQIMSLAQLSRYRNLDRKSTRLNSSHVKTSYVIFCLKKNREP